MSNITKTIKESLSLFDEYLQAKFLNILLGKNQSFEAKEFKSHLLQSQIRLIDAWIVDLKELHEKKTDFRNDDYERGMEAGKLYFIEDQISSLEEVKKDLLNN